ncbi:hypothetical protein MCAMS1_01676 [biofilm metagenome]
MYTHCPDCGKAFPVNKKQQRTKKAQIFCNDCKKKFNVLAGLADKKAGLSGSNKESQSKPAQLMEETKTEISASLLTEAKTKFIPKEGTSQPISTTKKPELQPYLVNISNVLRKNKTKAAVVVPQAPAPKEKLPWESDTKQPSNHWSIGAMVGLLLLLGQVAYFELPKASQQTAYRTFLEKLCQRIGCKLADYKNLNEITVLKSSLVPQPNQTIVFTAIINNQAIFKQRLPNIQLNLMSYNDELIAQRIFYPMDYLPHSPAKLFMTPDETVEAMLTITVPKRAVGGYNFNLVY